MSNLMEQAKHCSFTLPVISQWHTKLHKPAPFVLPCLTPAPFAIPGGRGSESLQRCCHDTLKEHSNVGWAFLPMLVALMLLRLSTMLHSQQQ